MRASEEITEEQSRQVSNRYLFTRPAPSLKLSVYSLDAIRRRARLLRVDPLPFALASASASLTLLSFFAGSSALSLRPISPLSGNCSIYLLQSPYPSQCNLVVSQPFRLHRLSQLSPRSTAPLWPILLRNVHSR